MLKLYANSELFPTNSIPHLSTIWFINVKPNAQIKSIEQKRSETEIDEKKKRIKTRVNIKFTMNIKITAHKSMSWDVDNLNNNIV